MTNEMTRREAVERAACLPGLPDFPDYPHGAHGAGGRFRNAGTEASQSLIRSR